MTYDMLTTRTLRKRVDMLNCMLEAKGLDPWIRQAYTNERDQLKDEIETRLRVDYEVK